MTGAKTAITSTGAQTDLSPVSRGHGATQQKPGYSISSPQPGVLDLALSGCWKIDCPLPPLAEILTRIDDCRQTVRVSTAGVTEWDSLLIVFPREVLRHCRRHGIEPDLEQVPEGARRLLQLAEATPETALPRKAPPPAFRARIGLAATRLFTAGQDMARFTGEIVLELLHILGRRSYFLAGDFFYFIQAAGVEALPIVSLIAILVGIILGFVGAIQLSMFGAQIYVANLVALSMVLEMGAMMSGIIMAGRTGAAYAAQLGTMRVSEEIDALQTMGINPIGFLVLPRILALALMLPLLCVYADLLGIAGGVLIGVSMLDVSLVEYLRQVQDAVTLGQCSQGIIKSMVYGVLVGFSGCYHGMRCGRNASAVGESTTAAVVMGIVLIVVADAVLTILFNIFKVGAV